MDSSKKNALIGGIVGGVIGTLFGIFVIAGISIAAPHPETSGVALLGFLIAFLVFILLGLIFGYCFKKYKVFFITGLIGVVIQVGVLLFTFNLNTQNKILYWLSYPGLILIFFLILGIIIQKFKK